MSIKRPDASPVFEHENATVWMDRERGDFSKGQIGVPVKRSNPKLPFGEERILMYRSSVVDRIRIAILNPETRLGAVGVPASDEQASPA
ncbi:MAG: hypothetical protein U5R14_15395 [Gemmatimonadota bacterium]|nr:hypothetical protein [Gemmatimonadota bacterium]